MDRTLHMKEINLTDLRLELVGKTPTEFDEAVKPLRTFLNQFNEDGQMAKLMLYDNVTNHKAGDVYVRELKIPKGAIILSRVHKRALVNIISLGTVEVIDSTGHHVYEAPCTFVSDAGTQRVVYAHEETVWNTAHITNKNTPDGLVEDLTLDNYSEYLMYSQQLEHQENI